MLARSLGGDIPWTRAWQPPPVFLAGESHGQRSLAGYSPRGCTKSATTERLSMHTRQLRHYYLNTSPQTSWAWHKDAVLLCCVQRCTVKYTRAQPPVEDARMWQCTPDTWTTLHDRACRHTVASLQVHNLQVRMQGTYSRGISESLCSIVETNTTL